MKSYKIQRNPFIVSTDDQKIIREHFGLASSGQSDISIAHMIAPPGWGEPHQTPEFDEYTFIIKGKKQFEIEGEVIILEAGESIFINKGSRVRYSNPFEDPCEYLAICKPAFSPDTVNRE
ncbi:MAG: cupin domain-containing protein [Bacteroidia bacterium]|nr:cupin domain-containing protein [Bacteroidia bacterium]MBT8269282.1 cupin domain-containing protein [Bacteroidia bacterium]NNF83436.1 cupin domain-containing protein [Flavobacteriaceae bacterium]NNK69444.1 cupin domain-containing protein [Flavobacteriaceae bacterium]NNL81229.1 cupin domain-containing protein [Flavobacteriaceae bacterium]